MCAIGLVLTEGRGLIQIHVTAIDSFLASIITYHFISIKQVARAVLQNVLHANALFTYEIVFMPFLSFNDVRKFSSNLFVCSGADKTHIYIRGFQYS